uniref:XPG-I domain-containing protein n=2 Tax=Chaetoceros debilis TaxID=122233 RepID=A0A7S3PVU5_9STRA|mmetsp:Transcript_2574/g.3793  ORF Transcript_2574/g.3793 Transcript_2574/m.3793 type:complete len:500 (+) Transcript_2574:107-1606(+)
MGITNLLPALSSVEHKVTLCGSKHFQIKECQGNRNESNGSSGTQRRNIRIGVDISSWIAAACHSNTELIDERHFSNFGRNELTTIANADDPSSQEDLHQQQLARNFISTATKSVLRRIKSIQSCLSPDLIVVLDGGSPPIKKATVDSRKQLRANAAQQRDELVSHHNTRASGKSAGKNKNDAHGGIGNTLDARSHLSNHQKISAAKRAGATSRIIYSALVDSIFHILREKQIAFLVAPYEADGQLAIMNNQSLIDYVISEDSDLIPYGCNACLYKLKTFMTIGDESDEAYQNCRGTAILLRKQDLTAVTSTSFNLYGFTDVMITCMCIASGCDYAKSLKGIGLVSANSAVREAFETKKSPMSPLEILFGILFHKCHGKVNDDEKGSYTVSFIEALICFRHPVVFDGSACVFSNINSPDEQLMEFAPYAEIVNSHNIGHSNKRLESIVGELYPKELCSYVVQGVIDPKTWEIRNKNDDNPQRVQDCLQEWIHGKDIESGN